MMGQLRLFFLIVAASFSGVFCSELLCRSTAFRDAAGRLCGRGHLVALAAGHGIYESDLAGEEPAADLVALENLRRAARQERADVKEVDRQLTLMRAQFGNNQTFLGELQANGLSEASLRERVVNQLRSLQWLEQQITAEKAATEQECKAYYESHRALFTQPVRFRAAHLFLAAPAETPPEVVQSKRELIDALALRLSNGETLPQLAAEASEDEATKSRGGDLGFFSAARVPSDFFTEVEKLAAGERGKPFRSHLGFHIVEVAEVRPTRVLPFEEARGEVVLALAKERRALIAERLADMLSNSSSARPN
ncbi:MAG: hypothetical protein DMF06_11195 [Verrucomicrobia bacterium]|nr:MAG: hypothetical protein DMF06_11195 [Verrucomicrobiota bacterium]